MNELVRGIGTAILATSVLLPFGASAAEKSKVPGAFSANVGLVSEYYFRGISQNDDAPALQGGFDYEISPSGDGNEEAVFFSVSRSF
jgi:uncharacterized protein (TIGR02001 family)